MDKEKEEIDVRTAWQKIAGDAITKAEDDIIKKYIEGANVGEKMKWNDIKTNPPKEIGLYAVKCLRPRQNDDIFVGLGFWNENGVMEGVYEYQPIKWAYCHFPK